MKYLLIFLMSFTALAKEDQSTDIDRIYVEPFFKRSKKKKKDINTLIGIRYQRVTNEFSHREQSSNSNFHSLNSDIEIPTPSLGLEFNREFLVENLFSFSFITRASIIMGTSQGATNNDTQDYNKEVSGNSIGAGGSLNLNTEGFGLKIQPFFSTVISRNSEEYQLTYSLRDTSKPPVNINHEVESLQAQYSIGTRFINESLGLMSFLSIDYNHVFQSDNTISASSTGEDLGVSNTSGVEEGSISGSFGFGLAF